MEYSSVQFNSTSACFTIFLLTSMEARDEGLWYQRPSRPSYKSFFEMDYSMITV